MWFLNMNAHRAYHLLLTAIHPRAHVSTDTILSDTDSQQAMEQKIQAIAALYLRLSSYLNAEQKKDIQVRIKTLVAQDDKVHEASADEMIEAVFHTTLQFTPQSIALYVDQPGGLIEQLEFIQKNPTRYVLTTERRMEDRLHLPPLSRNEWLKRLPSSIDRTIQKLCKKIIELAAPPKPLSILTEVPGREKHGGFFDLWEPHLRAKIPFVINSAFIQSNFDRGLLAECLKTHSLWWNPAVGLCLILPLDKAEGSFDTSSFERVTTADFRFPMFASNLIEGIRLLLGDHRQPLRVSIFGHGTSSDFDPTSGAVCGLPVPDFEQLLALLATRGVEDVLVQSCYAAGQVLYRPDLRIFLYDAYNRSNMIAHNPQEATFLENFFLSPRLKSLKATGNVPCLLTPTVVKVSQSSLSPKKSLAFVDDGEVCLSHAFFKGAVVSSGSAFKLLLSGGNRAQFVREIRTKQPVLDSIHAIMHAPEHQTGLKILFIETWFGPFSEGKTHLHDLVLILGPHTKLLFFRLSQESSWLQWDTYTLTTADPFFMTCLVYQSLRQLRDSPWNNFGEFLTHLQTHFWKAHFSPLQAELHAWALGNPLSEGSMRKLLRTQVLTSSVLSPLLKQEMARILQLKATWIEAILQGDYALVCEEWERDDPELMRVLFLIPFLKGSLYRTEAWEMLIYPQERDYLKWVFFRPNSLQEHVLFAWALLENKRPSLHLCPRSRWNYLQFLESRRPDLLDAYASLYPAMLNTLKAGVCRTQDLQRIDQLITLGLDVTPFDIQSVHTLDSFFSTLPHASQLRTIGLFSTLLTHNLTLFSAWIAQGAKPHQYYEGETLLHFYLRHTSEVQIPFFKKLLDLVPSLVNVTDAEGLTPLHLAARQSEAAITLLICYGANPNVKTKVGLLPIAFSLQGKDPISNFRLLLRLSSAMDSRNEFAIFFQLLSAQDMHSTFLNECVRIVAQNSRVISYLLNKKMAQLQTIRWTGQERVLGFGWLQWAVILQEGSTTELLEPFLELVNEKGEKGLTALHLAYLVRKPHLVRFLITHGANRHAADDTGTRAHQIRWLISES